MLRLTSAVAALVLLGNLMAGAALAAPYTGNTGPGGFSPNTLSSSFRLWLKGDTLSGSLSNGAPVSVWADSSAFGYNVTGSNTPTFNAGTGGILNGQPAVVFNNNPAASTSTYLQNTAVLSAGAGNFTAQNATLFEAYLTGPYPPNDHLGISTTGTGGSAVDSYQSINSYNNDFRSVRINGAQVGFPSSGAHIKGVVSNSADNSWRLFTDGAQLLSTTQSWGLNSTYDLGRNSTHPNSSFLGQVGETVIFNKALNTAERVIVENYLSSKFDINLNTGGGAQDKYAGDALGLDYDQNVFGVGRVDAANEVTNAGSAGFGIEVVGGASANLLNDGEFIMAGHAVQTNSIVPGGFADPNFVGERWARVWNVDLNGGSADATLAFNFDDAGLTGQFDAGASYSLLYTTNPALNDWQILSGAPIIQPGNTITFNLDSSLLHSGFFTLGIDIGYLPEPGTGVLLGVMGLLFQIRRRKSGAA